MSVDRKQPADTAAPFDPASAGWQRHAVDCRSNLGAAFGRQLPLRLPGRAQASQPPRPRAGRHADDVCRPRHGPNLLYANARQPQTTVQLDIHFVDAVRVGDFVEARCTVVRRTRTLVFMSAELVVGERVVATANGIWKTLGKG